MSQKQYNSIDPSHRTRRNHRNLPRNNLTTETLIEIPTANSTFKSKPRTVRDIEGNILDVEQCGLDDVPLSYQVISSYETQKASESLNGLTSMLNLSKDKQFLYVTLGSTLSEGKVLNTSKHIKRVYQSHKELCFELRDLKTFVSVGFEDVNIEFPRHLGSVFDILRESNLSNIKHRIRDSGNNSEKAKSRELKRLESRAFPTINADDMYGDPRSRSGRTRSASATAALKERKAATSTRMNRWKAPSQDSVVEVKEPEIPAKFEPPLKHKFSDGKTFLINYSDFKTLYNNDWINDTLIDFFIKFEIDQVISKGIMKTTDVYALNSFFFSKMMTKPVVSNVEEIDYYNNVAKWVQKIDLFKYNNLIIPINENSHWYGCIIVGLAEFVEKKKLEQEMINDQMKAMGPLMKYNQMTVNEGLLFPGKVNLFVIDSLQQKHTGIHLAFRTFLMSFCKERYGITMEKKDMTFRSTKVPIQNNFNDCGIHLIHNFKKFLNDRDGCLDVWNKKPETYREFFKASERSGLRKEWINFLLDLHHKMTGIPPEVPEPVLSKEEKQEEDATVKESSSSQSLDRGTTTSEASDARSAVELDPVQFLISKTKGMQGSQFGSQPESQNGPQNGSQDDLSRPSPIGSQNGSIKRSRGETESPRPDSGIHSSTTTQDEANDDFSDDDIEILDTVKLDNVRVKKKNFGKKRVLFVTVANGLNRKVKPGLRIIPPQTPGEAAEEIKSIFGCKSSSEEEREEESEENRIRHSSDQDLSRFIDEFDSSGTNTRVLVNKDLDVRRIKFSITPFAAYLFNNLFPAGRKFDENQKAEIYQFRKAINTLSPENKKKVIEEYRIFKQKYNRSGSDRPRNEKFIINPIGPTGSKPAPEAPEAPEAVPTITSAPFLNKFELEREQKRQVQGLSAIDLNEEQDPASVPAAESSGPSLRTRRISYFESPEKGEKKTRRRRNGVREASKTTETEAKKENPFEMKDGLRVRSFMSDSDDPGTPEEEKSVAGSSYTSKTPEPHTNNTNGTERRTRSFHGAYDALTTSSDVPQLENIVLLTHTMTAFNNTPISESEDEPEEIETLRGYEPQGVESVGEDGPEIRPDQDRYVSKSYSSTAGQKRQRTSM